MPLKLLKSVFILLLIGTLKGYSQTKVYKSLATEYLSTSQVEWIERDITFSDSLITIKTITDSANNLQKFLVIDSGEDELIEIGKSKYYRCSSPDRKATSIFFIPLTDKVERIEVLVPLQLGEKPQHYRFHLD